MIKKDYDTQEQCAMFDEYLAEYNSDRFQHHTGAYGYDEAEWEAFQAGWNAAKAFFGVDK